MPGKRGDSWFSAKSILVEELYKVQTVGQISQVNTPKILYFSDYTVYE